MAIAIFGGSFNPPANSHLNLAMQVLNKVKSINKVIFVPVSTKYNKQNLAKDNHRFNMLKIICDKYKNIEVSDVEMKSRKQLYTIETLNYFKKEYPDEKIYFVIGTDNLKYFKDWKNPEEILKNYKIIVLERDSDRIDNIIDNDNLLRKYRSSIKRVENQEKIDLSSTIIREKIKNNEEILGLVDDDVLKYIKKEQLYKFIN